jgi:hypothetical protein
LAGIVTLGFRTSYIGPQNLFRAKKATILNSRQSKYPLGSDRWINNTNKAVAYAVENRLTVLTSLGMNTWEIVPACVARYGGNAMVVVLPSKGDGRVFLSDVTQRFRLCIGKAGITFLDNRSSGKKKEWLSKRDRFIVDTADLILPVSVREGGNLNSLINGHRKKVNPDFSAPYEKPLRSRPRYSQLELNPAIFEDDLIVHFTRSSSLAWPGESDFDFYMGIIRSKNEYVHSARNALVHILKSGIIHAGSRHIRGGFRVVGFTAVNPDNIRSLFRYRPRLVNPYFEPYGIALPKRLASKLGIRPVLYGTPDIYPNLDDDIKPYFQNVGNRNRQWRMEKEWRRPGDFSLYEVPEKDMTVIVSTPSDVEIIKQYTGLRAVSIFL